MPRDQPAAASPSKTRLTPGSIPGCSPSQLQHDPVRGDHDERAVGDAGRLEVDAEGARCRALGLEVGELLERYAELLAEGRLRVGLVARHAVHHRTRGTKLADRLLVVYEEAIGELRATGAVMYGVSCDQTDSQAAFREKLGVSIEQLSDFEPKGAASRAFGAYFEPTGVSNRALVVVGPDGVVAWSWEGEHPGVLPGVNLVFDGLAAAG